MENIMASFVWKASTEKCWGEERHQHKQWYTVILDITSYVVLYSLILEKK